MESKADKGLFMLCVCMSVRHNRCTQQAALLCPFPFQVLVIKGNIQVFFHSVTLAVVQWMCWTLMPACMHLCHECPPLHTPVRPAISCFETDAQMLHKVKGRQMWLWTNLIYHNCTNLYCSRLFSFR